MASFPEHVRFIQDVPLRLNATPILHVALSFGASIWSIMRLSGNTRNSDLASLIARRRCFRSDAGYRPIVFRPKRWSEYPYSAPDRRVAVLRDFTNFCAFACNNVWRPRPFTAGCFFSWKAGVFRLPQQPPRDLALEDPHFNADFYCKWCASEVL